MTETLEVGMEIRKGVVVAGCPAWEWRKRRGSEVLTTLLSQYKAFDSDSGVL